MRIIKVDFFKADVIAKVKAFVLAVRNFHDIGNGKRSARVALRTVCVEHTVHIFKVVAVHFTAEKLIVNGTVQRIAFRQFFGFVQTEKANSFAVPFCIYLIDADIHSRVSLLKTVLF